MWSHDTQYKPTMSNWKRIVQLQKADCKLMSINQSIDQSINQMINQSISQSINQLIK